MTSAITPTLLYPRLSCLSPLRLGYVNCLAHHQATMQDKCKRNGMHLKRRPFTPDTQRQALMRPAIVRPECHYAGKAN